MPPAAVSGRGACGRQTSSGAQAVCQRLAGWPTQVSLTVQAIDAHSGEQEAKRPRRSALVGSAKWQSLSGRFSMLPPQRPGGPQRFDLQIDIGAGIASHNLHQPLGWKCQARPLRVSATMRQSPRPGNLSASVFCSLLCAPIPLFADPATLRWDTHSENVRETAKEKVSHFISNALIFR